jgi:hypothetical protein
MCAEKQDYDDALQRYKDYIKTLDYPDNMVGAQSNIGIFFWLVPRRVVDKAIDGSPNQQPYQHGDPSMPCRRYSYVFDAEKLVQYIMDKSHFCDPIPAIYWSPDNWYGEIMPFGSVLGFDPQAFATEVCDNMTHETARTHELISIVAIDTMDPRSGFVGIVNKTFLAFEIDPDDLPSQRDDSWQ